jgi:hypothetical protein
MGKTIASPVARWPGSVTLADPMTFPQFQAWAEATRAAQAVAAASGAQSDYDRALLPGVCACVETWNLAGLPALTPESFPATPRAASTRLIGWLIGEITRLVVEDETGPKV